MGNNVEVTSRKYILIGMTCLIARVIMLFLNRKLFNIVIYELPGFTGLKKLISKNILLAATILFPVKT